MGSLSKYFIIQTNAMDMNLSKFQDMVRDREVLACCIQSVWSRRIGNDLATEQQQMPFPS